MRSKRTRELPQLPLLFHRPAPITLTTLKQRDLEHFSYRCSGTGRCQCGFSLKKSHVKWISALYIITRNALAIRLLHEGKSAQEIAGLFHVHSATIYRLSLASSEPLQPYG